MRTKSKMYDDIRNWELEAGESFLDYFSSNMNEFNFMFWCLGKGYISESQLQAYELESHHGSEYLLGDEAYSVVAEESGASWEESCEKADKILAEFLSASITYQKRVDNFLKNVTPLKLDDALKEFKRPQTRIFFEINGERTYLTKDTPLTADIIHKAKWYRDDNEE